MEEIRHQSGQGPPGWTPRRAAIATLVACGVVGSVVLACRFSHVAILLLLAIVLATALKPIVEWLHSHGIRWSMAVATPFVVLSLSGILALVTIGPRLVDEASQFVATAPEHYEQWRARLTTSPHAALHRAGELMPAQLPLHISAKQEADEIPSDTTTPPAAGHNLGGWILREMLGVFVVCIFSTYWLFQEQRTIQAILVAVPQRRRDEVKSLFEAIDRKVGAYVRGQLLVCLSVGVMALTGYWLIGIPQAGFLAVIAAILEAVPILGPILGAIPAIGIALSVAPSKALAVVAVAIVIQQIESYLLIPRVMDRAVGLNGFVTLLAIAAFGALFGLLGAILAIPLAAIVQLLAERYLLSKDILEPVAPDGRDRSSRLQFELQSLIRDARMVVRGKSHATAGGNDDLEEAIEAVALDLERALSKGDDEPPLSEEVACEAISS